MISTTHGRKENKPKKSKEKGIDCTPGLAGR